MFHKTFDLTVKLIFDAHRTSHSMPITHLCLPVLSCCDVQIVKSLLVDVGLGEANLIIDSSGCLIPDADSCMWPKLYTCLKSFEKR